MIKEVKFFETGTINDNKLVYAVIEVKYRGQWLYVRHRSNLSVDPAIFAQEGRRISGKG